MFTSIDKALIGLVMALAYLATAFGYTVPDAWVTTAEGFIVAITPILVYLIPNKGFS